MDLQTFDLLFVGAGASTSYVVLSLLASLEGPPPDRPVRIAVVERAPDPFTGVPYGSRATRTALLITPLRDFLPEPERDVFARWLAENKDWVFEEFRTAGGPFSARWWDRHAAAVARDDFDDLYLPRYTFGEYLGRRTRTAIAQAAAQGRATVDVLRDDVVAVEPTADGYRVRCTGRVVAAARAVLAVGSPPVRSRLHPGTGCGPALVDDPFDDMGCAVDRVTAAVRRVHGRPAHVVVLGANAGTMDMLFQINDRPEAARAVFTVVSPSGRLPERLDEHHHPRPFRAERLEALERAGSAAAADVYEAALADIARGRDAGFPIADTLGPISQAVGRALPALSAEQRLEFADRWGVALGRHQRRAGWEYCEVVDQLVAGGRLAMVAGSFLDLVEDADGRTRVRYGVAGGAAEVLEPPADVVVNCAGPAGSLRLDTPPLLAQLVADGVCRLTPAGSGVQVDDDLSAAPGLSVMGPLLAGNVIAGRPVWHMEHCGRISAFGATLGARLAGEFAPVGS